MCQSLGGGESEWTQMCHRYSEASGGNICILPGHSVIDRKVVMLEQNNSTGRSQKDSTEMQSEPTWPWTRLRVTEMVSSRADIAMSSHTLPPEPATSRVLADWITHCLHNEPAIQPALWRMSDFERVLGCNSWWKGQIGIYLFWPSFPQSQTLFT